MIHQDNNKEKYMRLQNHRFLAEFSLSNSKRISIRKSNQIVSPISERINLSNKGWIIRTLTIVSLTSLIALFNYYGVINPKEQLIMIYTSVIISISILIFMFGWIFYRNPTPLRNLVDFHLH